MSVGAVTQHHWLLTGSASLTGHAQSLDMAREFIETGLAQAGRLSYVTDKCGEISLVRSAARQSETIDRIILY